MKQPGRWWSWLEFLASSLYAATGYMMVLGCWQVFHARSDAAITSLVIALTAAVNGYLLSCEARR